MLTGNDFRLAVTRAYRIKSKPFAGDVLIEEQDGQRQQQADATEQCHRDESIDIGDRCRRSTRENPCNSCGHVMIQNSRGWVEVDGW